MERLDNIRDMISIIVDKSKSLDRPMCYDCDKDFCCHNRIDIDILPLELEYLKTLKSKKLKKKFKNAKRQKEKIGSFTCPFLEDGRCSIYENRPLSCAAYFVFKDNSMDTPDRCLNMSTYQSMITLAQFTEPILKMGLASLFSKQISILDIYE